jgi:hypothetical protein
MARQRWAHRRWALSQKIGEKVLAGSSRFQLQKNCFVVNGGSKHMTSFRRTGADASLCPSLASRSAAQNHMFHSYKQMTGESKMDIVGNYSL